LREVKQVFDLFREHNFGVENLGMIAKRVVRLASHAHEYCNAPFVQLNGTDRFAPLEAIDLRCFRFLNALRRARNKSGPKPSSISYLSSSSSRARLVATLRSSRTPVQARIALSQVRRETY
jgi:hypothetical protein